MPLFSQVGGVPNSVSTAQWVTDASFFHRWSSWWSPGSCLDRAVGGRCVPLSSQSSWWCLEFCFDRAVDERMRASFHGQSGWWCPGSCFDRAVGDKCAPLFMVSHWRPGFCFDRAVSHVSAGANGGFALRSVNGKVLTFCWRKRWGCAAQRQRQGCDIFAGANGGVALRSVNGKVLTFLLAQTAASRRFSTDQLVNGKVLTFPLAQTAGSAQQVLRRPVRKRQGPHIFASTNG